MVPYIEFIMSLIILERHMHYFYHSHVIKVNWLYVGKSYLYLFIVGIMPLLAIVNHFLYLRCILLVIRKFINISNHGYRQVIVFQIYDFCLVHSFWNRISCIFGHNSLNATQPKYFWI